MAFDLNPQPKPNHKRGKQKGAARGKFSPETTKRIFEYDEYRCASCRSYRIESVPHHIIFKSACGQGTFDNGATVCRRCHDWAHGKCEGPNGEKSNLGRKWFEDYQERKIKSMELRE